MFGLSAGTKERGRWPFLKREESNETEIRGIALKFSHVIFTKVSSKTAVKAISMEMGGRTVSLRINGHVNKIMQSEN